MPKVVWFSGFSVKIESFDNEHKGLIDMLNTLYDAITIGKDNNVLPNILQELMVYTETHFKNEERAFERYNYPKYVEHKKEHDDFIKQLEDFYEKFSEGKASLSVDVFNMVHEWVKNHMMQSDKEYSGFLYNAGVR